MQENTSNKKKGLQQLFRKRTTFPCEIKDYVFKVGYCIFGVQAQKLCRQVSVSDEGDFSVLRGADGVDVAEPTNFKTVRN